MSRRSTCGLMLVGGLGMTGSATLAGIAGMQSGAIAVQYGTTGHEAFRDTDLPDVNDFRLGGWDLLTTDLAGALRSYGHVPQCVIEDARARAVPILPGVSSVYDFPPDGTRTNARSPASLAEGVAMVARDIAAFREEASATTVIVVNVGTPWSDEQFRCSPNTALDPSAPAPSALMYALGSARAGAHFVDFTPSRTLEYRAVLNAAEDAGVVLAGRDGSTGQTMVKVALAELFERRGIHVESWYSTNVIGNRDGYVLSHPEYSAAKIADKTDALTAEAEHVVRIEYVHHWGDRKESWDAIECSSWTGAPLSVRVNWRGHDSQLAAAMILDLARLTVTACHHERRGLVPELGFFFKRPLQREDTTLSARWDELVSTFA